MTEQNKYIIQINRKDIIEFDKSISSSKDIEIVDDNVILFKTTLKGLEAYMFPRKYATKHSYRDGYFVSYLGKDFSKDKAKDYLLSMLKHNETVSDYILEYHIIELDGSISVNPQK